MNLSKVIHARSSRGRPSLHLQLKASGFLRTSLLHTHPLPTPTRLHFPTPTPPQSGSLFHCISAVTQTAPLIFRPCSLPAFPVITCHPLHIYTHTPPHPCLSGNVPAFSSLGVSLPLCSDLNCSPSISAPDLSTHLNCSNQPLSICPTAPARIQAGSKVPRMLCVTLFIMLLSAHPRVSYL